MSQRYPQPNQQGGSALPPFPHALNTGSSVKSDMHQQLFHQQQQLMQMQRQLVAQQQMQTQSKTNNSQQSLPNSSQRPKGTVRAPSASSVETSNSIGLQPPLLSTSKPSVLNNAGFTQALSPTPASGDSSVSSPTKKDSFLRSQIPIAQMSLTQQTQLLTQCDWKDKTMWATRQILGGNSINGFLRATATAQRIKKQRARQLALTKKSSTSTSGVPSGKFDDDKKDAALKKSFDQSEEEQLKKDIMNPRTAKKIKAELEAGVQFCVTLHNLLRGILFEVDPSQAPHLPKVLKMEDRFPNPGTSSNSLSAPHSSTMKQVMPPPPSLFQSSSSVPTPASALPLPAPSAPVTSTTQIPPKSQIPQRQAMPPASTPPVSHSNHSNKTTASPGNPTGSSLRKQRKKKLPPSNQPPLQLSEFDASGKRVFTKKEHNFRIFDVLRFRPLKQGDFVAARVTSRDLWILARVLKDYPGLNMPHNEFLQLSEAKRDSLFRERVLLKDVEEKDEGSSNQVARNLVLPLPRTYSEAAEWCQRFVTFLPTVGRGMMLR